MLERKSRCFSAISGLTFPRPVTRNHERPRHRQSLVLWDRCRRSDPTHPGQRALCVKARPGAHRTSAANWFPISREHIEHAPFRPSSFLIHKRGAFTNVLTGSAGGFQVSLLDYTYHLGKATVAQTVAAFSPGARLPDFELRPENIIDKMKVALAHQHADFDSHPEFSKRYVLQSPDKKPVESFGPEFPDFFRTTPSREEVEHRGSRQELVDLPPREGRERYEHEIVSRPDFHNRKHILLCLRAEEAVRIESVAVAKRVPPLDLDTRAYTANCFRISLPSFCASPKHF
jgi:hypothetical protein